MEEETRWRRRIWLVGDMRRTLALGLAVGSSLVGLEELCLFLVDVGLGEGPRMLVLKASMSLRPRDICKVGVLRVEGWRDAGFGEACNLLLAEIGQRLAEGRKVIWIWPLNMSNKGTV